MNPFVLPGLAVGHATDADAGTGCTVLLGPFRAAAEVTGFATGTRELDALQASHLVPRIDALLFTGGSAFGLAAAEGVVAWHEERRLGYETGFARVPIVPAAVIYDLGRERAARRPDAAMGRAACDDARADNPAEGRVGAGTGATVGKVLGRERAMPGGLGRGHARATGFDVVALVVVNPFGDVLDGRGGILAGARTADGRFANTAALLLSDDATELLSAARTVRPGTNTTLAAVVTDAPFTRVDLQRVARLAATAVARRISPVNTPFDGDVVVALSTAEDETPAAPVEVLALGVAAASALEMAIERAVRPVRT